MYMRKICIDCGSSKKVIPFIYKDSEKKLRDKHKDENAIIVDSDSKKDSPDYKCKVCGHDWKFNGGGKRFIKGKSVLVGRTLDLPMLPADSDFYKKGSMIIIGGRKLNEIGSSEEE
jgi:hypothetical protein